MKHLLLLLFSIPLFCYAQIGESKQEVISNLRNCQYGLPEDYEVFEYDSCILQQYNDKRSVVIYNLVQDLCREVIIMTNAGDTLYNIFILKPCGVSFCGIYYDKEFNIYKLRK